MRELKFRAWYNNKMWEVNSVEWVEYDDHPAGAYLYGLEVKIVVDKNDIDKAWNAVKRI